MKPRYGLAGTVLALATLATLVPMGVNLALASGFPLLIGIPAVALLLPFVYEAGEEERVARCVGSGVLVGIYAFLGMFSIGMLFVPALVLYWTAAALYWRRSRSA